MSPLLYLQTRKIKNRLKEILHSPSEIIVAVLFGFILISSFFTEGNIYLQRDTEEFFVIVFLLYSLSFVLSGKNGFLSGASMFSMADVNLVFTAPIKKKKVLSYGLFQQLGKSLALSFVVLYQAQTVKDVYGFGLKELLIVFAGLGVTGLMSQMFSMTVYSLTGHSDRLRKIGKGLFYGYIAIFALFAAFLINKEGFSIENAVRVLSGKISMFFPISSAVSFTVRGIITRNLKCVLFGAVYFLIYCGLYVFIINMSRKDYYEDVLKGAEVSFSAITAQKEGKAFTVTPMKIKLGKTGFSKGWGCDIIREKIKKENRRGKVLFISLPGIVSVMLSVLYCFISADSVFVAFALCIYSLSFTVTMGNWAKELRYPYIYLIPEKPFRKLLTLISAYLPSLFAESVLCALPMYFILDCSVSEVISIAVSRFAFGFMFMGINLLLQRIFGNSDRKTLSMMTYMFIVILLSVPAVAVGVFAYTFLFLMHTVPFIFMTAVCFIEALILIYLSRNILEKSEINNK